jgi:hypothetical protein
MKMKKMMLVMLTLLIGGAASMNAQVRIGGTVDPDASAVLDLNKTNATGAQTGNLGLSLPRVNLTAADMYLVADQVPKNGTMIYNTSTSLNGVGVYYWVTNKWVKTNEGVVINTGTGLSISGTGTATSPYVIKQSGYALATWPAVSPSLGTTPKSIASLFSYSGTFPAHSVVRIPVTGLQATDFCISRSPHITVAVSSASDITGYFLGVQNEVEIDVVVGIWCFRLV